jgi:hypothetical protein
MAESTVVDAAFSGSNYKRFTIIKTVFFVDNKDLLDNCTFDQVRNAPGSEALVPPGGSPGDRFHQSAVGHTNHSPPR